MYKPLIFADISVIPTDISNLAVKCVVTKDRARTRTLISELLQDRGVIISTSLDHIDRGMMACRCS